MCGKHQPPTPTPFSVHRLPPVVHAQYSSSISPFQSLSDTAKNTALLSNRDRQELRSTMLVWPALLRKLDRLDPSYKN